MIAMDMAYQNAVQFQIAEQLENIFDYNERSRFHMKDDPFQLSERQFTTRPRDNATIIIRRLQAVFCHGRLR